MSSKKVVFSNKQQAEFIKELRQRVNQYFQDNNISRYGNWNMYIKSAFMICLYFIPLAILVSGSVQSTGWMFFWWMLTGFGMSGIGLSIMHDANHGSYSKHKWVNQTMGWLVNFLGAYHVNWKIQHNVLHHSFTNVHEHDHDLETAAMRFSPNQERKKLYKYQAFYAPFIYGLMTIYWLVSKDFIQVFQYNKENLLASQNLNLRKAMTHLVISKLAYVGLVLVLPIIMIDLPWYQILLGFFVMQFSCGLMLALIFQTAHVIEETDFFKTNENGELENNWAIHQLKTTANFADKSKFFSWFIGGLNYQVEHHLFPNICHVHYKKISKIVKATANEFQLPYYQHRTFLGALKSHFSLLHKLGTGKYDQQMIPVDKK